MDDLVRSENNMLPVTPMELDYMDELLLEGCWLEAANASDFLQHVPSTSNALFEPSFIWPPLEASSVEPRLSLVQKTTQEERKKSSFPENVSTSEMQGQSTVVSYSQNMTDLVGYSDLNYRWWIGPRGIPGPESSVKDRLIQAVGYIKDSLRNKDVLIQLWVPVNSGGRNFLTTNDQPFSIDLNSPSLASYRNISVNYEFPTEDNSMEVVGLPGRVFKGKVPEWTPDVRFFRSDEYARVGHAQQYGVRGSLALPVFEQGSRNCLGVIEVVTTAQKVKYRPELESVCKALEAFDLRSSEVPNIQNVEAHDRSYETALPEILEVLKAACGTHGLPLAQTWVPCILQGKGGSRHSDENYADCVSTIESACYIADPRMQGFYEACSEHHLLKGQGIVGRAFLTNQPCFSSDVTSFTKTDYPLSHHARMFELQAAVAIRLRSVHTGKADFVLELFLPVGCNDFEQQRTMLSSLSIIIQQVCRSLRIVTEKELKEEEEEETILPVDKEVASPNGAASSSIVLPSVHLSPSERYSQEGSSWPNSHVPVQKSDNVVEQSRNDKPLEVSTENSAELPPQQEASLGGSVLFGGGDGSSNGEFSFSNAASRTVERRRSKAEKPINLQTLQQYFAGSLKDAAKSLGVCPTTLKRICRQNGIQRWPSRKIKKVGHSLQKLQLVIDSVHGSSGSFQIDSFYSSFPELASPNLSRTSPLSTSKQTGDRSKPSSPNLEGKPQATPSRSRSSSYTHSSSSSQCCSTGAQPSPSAANNISGVEDLTTKDNSDSRLLKRVRSEAEIGQVPEPLQNLLSEQPKSKSFKPLATNRENLRVKAAFGEEKIRFRLQNHWTYATLLEEIARRFNIENTDGFQLRYMDDDSEWVLLTCDADLEECIDICGSSQNQTVRLSLSQIPRHGLGSSLGRIRHLS